MPVSLHIGRGDYVKLQGCVETFHVCTLEYYQNAVNYIKERYDDVELFVFSNDMPWVRENIKLNTKMTYIDYTTEDNAYEDMFLMSNCKHNIIANSTFSWCGALLNNNSNNIVISPKIWFIKPEMKSHHVDLVPDEWIKL